MARIFTDRKSGFIQRSGQMRRQTQWLELEPVRVTMGAASTAILLNSLNTVEKALRPFTVVRARGILHAASDQSVATEFWHATFGFAVVSDQAVAIGVTALPTPDTDRESDLWFVYEELASQFEFKTAVGFDATAGILKSWDSKAMRKVEEGQDIAVVTETSAVSAGGALFMSAGRVLIKLHWEVDVVDARDPKDPKNIREGPKPDA